MKNTKKRLSNNRERHVSVTETVLGSTPVIVLSRTATCASPRGRTVLRGSVTGLMTKGALVMVTRELSAIGSDSRVFIMGSKGMATRNARRRLLISYPLCGRV